MPEKVTVNVMDNVSLRRDFFIVRPDGYSEFDWILSELGIAENLHADIEEIDIYVDSVHYTPES